MIFSPSPKTFSSLSLQTKLKAKTEKKKLTDDVLVGHGQEVALLDGELLVVDELGDLFLGFSGKRKKRGGEEEEERG